MTTRQIDLDPGLYFVATPIGTARDITLRALDILASANVLAAEDTRSLRKLMDIHGIALGGRPLLAYHDHNGTRMRPRLLDEIAAGKSVAYASEAGTPLIADPGFQLGRAVADAGHLVTAAPGASALLAALTVSGLATDRFLFAGFLPNASGQRKTALAELGPVPATLVFYESPKRLAKSLADMAQVLGAERHAVIARELTKKFEEIQRGTLSDLAAHIAKAGIKGEVVVLIERADVGEISSNDLDNLLRTALACASVKDAVADVTAATGLPRREVYQRALNLGKEGGGLK